MSALDSRERQRLWRLLGMVGANHDGEALNAARLADRLVRSRGLTWEQVIGPAPESELIHDERQGDLLDDWPARWSDAVTYCATNQDALNERSRAFVEQLGTYTRTPSPRQLGWLRHCVEHLLRGGART